MLYYIGPELSSNKEDNDDDYKQTSNIVQA